VEAAFANREDPIIPAKLRAALKLVEASTRAPWTIDAAFIAELREAGLDDLAIEEAENLGFHYNVINRIADALDFYVPNDDERARIAKILNFAGGKPNCKRVEPSWSAIDTGPDRIIRPTELEEGRSHLLTHPAATTPELRTQVFDFARAVLAQREANQGALSLPMPEHDLPEDVAIYVKKLAEAAYKVLDEDVDRMREAGRTAAEIFEFTLVGSVAAALVGTEAVFGALYDTENAQVLKAS